MYENLLDFMSSLVGVNESPYVEELFLQKCIIDNRVRVVRYLRAKNLLKQIIYDLGLLDNSLSYRLIFNSNFESSILFVSFDINTKNLDLSSICSNINLLFSEIRPVNHNEISEVFGKSYLFKMCCNNLNRLDDIFLTKEESVALNLATLNKNLSVNEIDDVKINKI